MSQSRRLGSGVQGVLIGAGLLALACAPPKASDDGDDGDDGDDTQTGDADASETSDATGSESGDTTTTETGDPDCDLRAYVECRAPILAAHMDCLRGCGAPDTCAGVACEWGCEGARELGVIDCAEQHCPERVNETWICETGCYVEAGECPLTPECDPKDCVFLEMVCEIENCHPCQVVRLDYAYADSCAIALPGVVPAIERGFTVVEVDTPEYMQWEIRDDVAACDEPYIGAIWWPDYDGIDLCPVACNAFAGAGALVVEFGSPPCE